MSNRFIDKMRSKPDMDLIHVVLERASFQEEAVRAAEQELIVRGIIEVGETYDQYSERLNTISEDILHKIRVGELGQDEQPVRDHSEELYHSNEWQWLPDAQRLDLLWYYFFGAGCLLALQLPGIGWWWTRVAGFLILFVGLWQVDVISEPKTRRAFHFQGRIWYALFIVVFIYFRNYLKWDSGNNFADAVSIFLLILIFTGLPSLAIYQFVGPRFVARRLYFLHYFKYSAWISILFLLGMLVVQKQLFIVEKSIVWDEKNPITADDFRGYPDLLTDYDGAINSTFNYEFNDEGQLMYLNAVCHTHDTWINPWDKDSYFLLQHERYHFNLTEVVARMARRAVVKKTLKDGKPDRAAVIQIITEHNFLRDSLQDVYDTETDHSVIEFQQGLWQNKIDSLLIELDSYWTSDVLKFSLYESDSIKYFRNLNIDPTGEFHPVNALLPGEEKYSIHYRVEYEDQEIVNVSLWCQGRRIHSNRIGACEVRIDNSANLSEYTYFNIAGESSIHEDGYHKKSISRQGLQLIEQYYDRRDEQISVGNIFRIEINLDDYNRAKEKRYYDEKGIQVKNENGSYGLFYEYDTSFPLANRVFTVDAHQRSTVNNNGIHLTSFQLDSIGNIIRVSEYDDKMKSVNQYETELYIYDELGRVIEKSFIDTQGQLVQDENGVARITWAEDRYGNDARMSTYNRNNVLTFGENDYATIYERFDRDNNRLLLAKYDTGNKLIFDDGDYGKVKYQSDSLGRYTEIINYNGYDYPVKPEGGGRIERRVYDSSGREMISRYYTITNEPDTAEDGVASFKVLFDDQGRELFKEYYDLSGEKFSVVEDVSTFVFEYDSLGNKVESRFYKPDGRLAFANGGISINRYKYSLDNKMIERSYYDSLDQLAMFEGAAIIKYLYDDKGREIESTYYDQYRILRNEGFAIKRLGYENGKLMEERFLDASGSLVKNEIAVIKYGYDRNGHQDSRAYFDYKGQPIDNEEGVYSYEYVYQNGYMVQKRTNYSWESLSYSDAKKDPVRIDYLRDKYGNVLEQHSYTIWQDVKSTSVVKYKRDLYDRVIEEAYFDQDDKPVNFKGKYHKISYDRDMSGNILQKEYFNKSGDLSQNEEGYARIVKTYSLNGHSSTKRLSLADIAALE